MKDIELNPLDKNQRRVLQFGVILLTLLFIIGYFFHINRKTGLLDLKNSSVYLQKSKLYIFGHVYPLKQYPDKILMHYPYLLIIEGDKPLTTVFNLETQKKEKEVKDVLLDYYKGNIVYNRKETYFNDQNLDKFCDSAFIKNPKEILCIAKQNKNAVDNMLININPDKPNLWIRDYQSKNLLTTVSIIDNKLYIGEIDHKTLQNYVSINKKLTPVENIASMIYPIRKKIYFVSFASALNKSKENYYIINQNKADKIPGHKIIFYEN